MTDRQIEIVRDIALDACARLKEADPRMKYVEVQIDIADVQFLREWLKEELA